ncbi:DNA repair protein RecN [Thermocoleostomius sinensis]|uniref:DNA repair protein RecN n=1 Tax=Thermocoleostomius sinensis A174 TaxID=2016057 RepID=A0A9E8ZCA1_9CYAN|nr:DNA repair protein RecN [Thermocoleostomius sinensis]WAL60625.1 DNA repair protein RecN [Thermocoleostomius sinensis A174]
MLISLHIENFALVDRLELELGMGLNVLTGETGAGKSIILDALDAALGGKVSARAVRTGADRALIEASFDLDPGLIAWLSEQQIELVDDMSLVCSRELTVNRGNVRSRSRVNGVLVNKQQMESLRDRLLEITAQGQTMQLGNPSLQRDWLDAFGGAALLEQREVVTDLHVATQQALKTLEKRRQFEQQRLQQLDLFEYQAKELIAANLSDPNELTELEQERQRLSHSVELQQQSYQVYQALYQNDSGALACADLLGQAETTLQDMLRYDNQLQPIADLVSEALAQVEEAGRLINQYGEGLETDPERLQIVEERIIQLKQICKKYGPTLTEAIAYSQQVQRELEELSGSGQSLEVLEQQFQEREAELAQACAKLTDLRQRAARSLEALLVKELKPLAMDKVQFKVDIAPVTPTATGADRITFVFSPNPGEPLQPLTEIASGGEMSRFLLALKACFSQVDSVGTMVFDEIDVGVSGRVAQAIAEKLHQLSRRHQVLCVTHQPIVAAMADNHYRVNKAVVDSDETATLGRGRGKAKTPIEEPANGAMLPAGEEVRTVVRVVVLDDRQRREELAELAGGKSDQEAIAFAESLLVQAANTRLTQSPTASTTKAATKSARSKTRQSQG